MTNEVKKEEYTQEQKDFILEYLNKGRPIYSKVMDPDKTGAFPDQQSTADNWIDRIDGPIADYDPLKTLYKKTVIKSCIANDYSEMSELERVEFVKNMLSNNHNVAIQTILSLEEVKKATDINTLCNALSKAINDKSLKDKVSKDPRISGPAFQMPGSFAHTTTATNEIWSAQSIIYLTSDIAKTFKDCPLTPKPEPEPVVEKPKWFETTSKDHQVRIEQWMEHVGMKDQAQDLIDKYGLPVAYEIVQTSMQAPADLKEASDGTFRSSKDSIQYFLENEVSAEKLANIPDLDAETVKASLDSVKKPEPRPDPIKSMSIELPKKAVSMPSAPQLSQLDAQKVHYASLMKDSVKLEGIEDSEIKAAVDVAFKASLENNAGDMAQWSGGFRYNLSKALGLETLAKDSSEYKAWASVIDDCSKKAIETATTNNPAPELAEQVATYTNVVNKKSLKSELASMSGSETLNPETYFKDRQVQKRMSAKAEKKVAREARKEERTEKRQERKDAMKEWFNKNLKSIVD